MPPPQIRLWIPTPKGKKKTKPIQSWQTLKQQQILPLCCIHAQEAKHLRCFLFSLANGAKQISALYIRLQRVRNQEHKHRGSIEKHMDGTCLYVLCHRKIYNWDSSIPVHTCLNKNSNLHFQSNTEFDQHYHLAKQSCWSDFNLNHKAKPLLSIN